MRAFLCALVLLLSAPAFAEKWALLIGINDYEDRNYIASLGAADNDARKLKEVLKSKMGFPEANIELLVSDGDNKPTRSNIIVALGKLAENAKAGDTVFVFYSGHGTEINGTTYLLPHDFKGRNQFTGTETALAISKFQELLKQVKTSALIMAWDMCRNDPFAKGKSGDAARAKLADTKAWQIVSDKARSIDSPVMVTLFACAPGQSSYEWQEKNRGYFAWFLEEGMKGAAVDATGNVTLGSLAKYVRTKVMEQTKISEPAVQSPTSSMDGASPEEFVLLRTGKPVANNTTKPTTSGVKTISTRSTISFENAPTGAKILVGTKQVTNSSWVTDLLEPSKEFLVTITAEGFRPKQVSVILEKGQTQTVDASLEKEDTTEPGPAPDPGNNTNVPPPQTGNLAEVVQQIMRAHNTSALFTMPAFQIDGKGNERMDTIGNHTDYKQLFIVQHPATNSFRIEYTTNAKAIKGGFDGKTLWKRDPQPVKIVPAEEQYQLSPCYTLWGSLKNITKWQIDKSSKDKSGATVLEMSQPDQPAIRIKLTLHKDFLIQRIQLFITAPEPNGGMVEFSTSYDKYTVHEGVPIPMNFRFVQSISGFRQTQYVYEGTTIKRSSFNKPSWFAGGY